MSQPPGEGYLLAADIGGTKSNVVLAVAGAERPGIVVQRFYASRDYDGLEPMLDDFLGLAEVAPHAGGMRAACLAVAGPVEAQQVTLTNLGWRISSEALARHLRIARVRLINDFAATGLGIDFLTAGQLETLRSGEPVEHAPRVVIGAGTGLGVCFLTWQGGRYEVYPSEAGHADFAPADEIQDRLVSWLRRRFGRVSYERVLSGPGLEHIFRFVEDAGMGAPSERLHAAVGKHADIAAVVAEFALAKLDPLAVRALDVFVAIYGAFAGNMALSVLARGGVYISGGIGPKISAKLKDGTFARAFADKGRFSGMLSSIPVCLVTEPQVGLYGALQVARSLSL